MSWFQIGFRKQLCPSEVGLVGVMIDFSLSSVDLIMLIDDWESELICLIIFCFPEVPGDENI